MAPGTTPGNMALVKMIKHFKWTKVATINPADYTAVSMSIFVVCRYSKCVCLFQSAMSLRLQ